MNLQQPDRVPVSLHSFNVWAEGWEWADQSFRKLILFAREHTECFYEWWPRAVNGHPFLTAHPSAAIISRETRERESTRYHNANNTPRGPIHQTVRRLENVHTDWTVEHWLKTDEDIERFLSIPYEPIEWDCSGLAEIDAKLGDRVVIFPGITDAICYVADLFEFGEYTVRAFADRSNIRRLLDAMQPRVLARLEAMLDAGAGPVFRLVGPEYVSPPYLPPELFREFVVQYDKPLVDLIHRHGRLVRAHSHGRCSQLLDMFADEMGVDALDPLEAPPDGDITLADAKRRIGDRCCLFGNMQFRDLETATPEQIDEMVRRNIEDAAEGGGFVLMPTAEPVTTPLSATLERNYFQYIESALKWGVY